MKLKVLGILPAYNEEGKVGIVIKKARPYVDKIVVIDDGSNDKTSEEAKKNGAIVIKHRANQGVGAAIRTGINYAKKHNYNVCVPMGADNQDKPLEIKTLLDRINKGYDLVQGSRYIKKGRTIKAPIFRKVTTRLFSIFFSVFSGGKITDASNGFRAFRTSLFEDKRINIKQRWLDRYELEPYILFKAISLNYRVTEAPVTKGYDKEKGYTKMIPFRDWWSITKPVIYLRLGIKS